MVELISGFPLVLQQYETLLRKKFILLRRSKRATFLQLFSLFIMFLLIFSIDKFVEKMKDDADKAIDKMERNSPLEYPIPACDQQFVLKMPCYDFVWSGNGSFDIEKIVKKIMRNNPGRPISEDRVKSFHTLDNVDAWVLSNPRRTIFALHFVKRNNTIISYGITIDEILRTRKGFDVPPLNLGLAFVLDAECEIARSLLEGTLFLYMHFFYVVNYRKCCSN